MSALEQRRRAWTGFLGGDRNPEQTSAFEYLIVRARGLIVADMDELPQVEVMSVAGRNNLGWRAVMVNGGGPTARAVWLTGDSQA